jgi:hypothetical protein
MQRIMGEYIPGYKIESMLIQQEFGYGEVINEGVPADFRC